MIRSVGSNAAVTWYEQNAGVRSQTDLARPYADFPNGEATPSPPPPLKPQPLWSPSREGAGALTVHAHPVLSGKPGEQAQEVAVLSETRWEATDWIPGPVPCWAGGLPSQLPFHLAPIGASVAAAVELRREKQMTPV